MQPWGEFWGTIAQIFIGLSLFAVFALGISFGFGLLLAWARDRWDW